MADEGGAWSSDGGQRWEASYAVQGEIDFTKDLHRREEWSDISEDESPVVYADISRSGEYHYHIIQTQDTPVAVYENEGVPRKDETPAASGFPRQESVVWRQHQRDGLPEVPAESMQYLPTSYPPALWQVAQKTEASFLHDGVIRETQKLKNNDMSVTVQQISAERKEDLSKNVFYQGSHLEGTLSVTSSLANEQVTKLETLETTRMDLSSQEEHHPQDSSSSGQILSYSDTVMLPLAGTSLPYREGQQKGTVESEYDSRMTFREQVGSGITGFPSSAEFPLVTCHEGETSIPLECLSQKCDANLSVPQEKEIDLSKSKPSPTRSDKRIIMTDQHFLKECDKEIRLDIPVQGCTNIDSSKVMKHPPLAEMDSLKDRGHAQLGVDVIGVLKKQKRKLGRPQKKKTLLKMAKRLKIAQESGEDTKDACHTNGAIDINMGQSDMQKQNVQLNNTNEKSLPSSSFFSGPMKECIYSLSTSPLPKSGIQDPLTPSSKYLEVLPKNSSKSNVKSAKTALCKQQNTQDSSNFSVPQVPLVGAASELPQKTDQISPSRKNSIIKIQNKTTNMEEFTADSLKQPIGNQGSGMTSLQKEGNVALRDDMSAIKQSSKLHSKCISAKKSSKKKGKVRQSEGLRDPCDEKCDLPQKDSVYHSLTSEAGVPSQMESTVELPKKLHKKISIKSSKAECQANFLPNTGHPQIISQKKLEYAVAVKDKNKKTRKQRQAKSGTPKRKKAAIADTQNEQELPSVTTHKDTAHQALSSSDEHKSENISTGWNRLGKEGRGPKRKGNSKTKRNVIAEDEGKDNMTQKEKREDLLNIKEHTGQSLTIAQLSLREEKAKKRKASDCEKNGLNLNSCSVEKVPNSPDLTLHDLNHSISQHQSEKLECKIEPTPKMLRCRKKAFTKGTNGAEACGPSQVVLTEDLLLKTDNVNPTTSDPQVTKQRKTQKEKLCDFKEEKLSEFNHNTDFQGRCVMLPQKTQPILKGSSPKKLRLSRAESALQDIALTVVTAEAAPKTRSLRKPEATEVIVPKEEKVQLSVANTSFDFAEEEFHVPVIKVTPRNDFSFEMTEQSARENHKTNAGLVSNSAETKSQISRERSSNTMSNLPEIKQPLGIPLSAAKPVKKISSKQRKQKSSVKQSVVGHNSHKVDEQHHKCTEIKLEQAEYALSAVDMGYPASIQQSFSTQPSPLAILKRKAGRPFKKKTLLRMAKILEIVQEGESCSTGNTEYFHEILEEKQLILPPRVKKEKGAIPLVSPSRRSLRTSISGRTQVDHLSLSTISIDTDHEGHADPSCSSALNRQPLLVQGFVNTVAQDSEKIMVDDTDEQDPQKLIHVETTTMRPLSRKKKRKVKRKMGWRKLNQQLTKAASIQKDDLLSNNEGEDGKCTKIKPEEAEFALSAVDMGHLAGSEQISSKQTSSSVMLKQKPGPLTKKTLLRMDKISKGVQEGKSNSTENGGSADCVEGIPQEKAQHRATRVKKEKGSKSIVTSTRRSLRALGSGRAQTDHPSLSATSIDPDHEGNTDTSCSTGLHRQSLSEKSCARELSPDSKKTTLNETGKQNPEKVTHTEMTTVRSLKRKGKRKTLKPKKKKKGWRKLYQQLASVASTQEDGVSPSNEDSANVNEEDGKSREIKPEQAEFALTAIDMGHSAGLQQNLSNQSPSARLKRKVGRPLKKKKTLLRMDKISKGVQEGKSNSTENGGFTDCVEGIPHEKAQHRAPRVKKEKGFKPIVTSTRRSLRALGSGRVQTDRPSLSATSIDPDHEEDSDTSCSTGLHPQSLSERICASELSPDSKKTTLDETGKQDPEKVTQTEMTTVRAQKRRGKRKTLKPKKKKKRLRKLYQQLASVASTQEDGVSPSNEDGADVNGEDGKSTEIKPEQAEFALTAVDMGHSTGLQQNFSNQSPSAMLKRKVGRPLKKKTLLRMAKLLKIVQEEEESSATGNMAISDNHTEKRQQHQPPRIKKEKMIKSFIPPKRRSPRTIESGKTESNHSFLSTISVDTDHEGNADKCSSVLNRKPLSEEGFENTLVQDDKKTTVGETDQPDHQEVTKADTTVVRTLKKKRKTKARNFKKSKVGLRKPCLQLAGVTSTQEHVLLLNNEDGASVSTNDADVSKVSSLPVSSKGEEQEDAILHSPQAAYGPQHQPLEASITALNQESDDAECHTALFSNKVKLQSGCIEKEKAKDVTTVKADESSQPVSVAQVTKLRRSSRHLNSTAHSTVDQEQSQTTRNSSETTLSTKSLMEDRTENLTNVLLNDENKREVMKKDDNPTFENQYSDLGLSCTNDQEAVPMPGQSKQEIKRGEKRKYSSKASQRVESVEVTDPTNNSGASLTVPFTTSNSQSASNEQENTLKKSEFITEKPMNRGTKAQKDTLLKLSENQSSDSCSEKMDASIHANHTIIPDFSVHTPLKSRTIVPSYETLRRSSRTSKTPSIFHRSEEYTSPVGGSSSSPTEGSQDDMQNPDKTLQPSTTTSNDPEDGQAVSASLSDTVEISTSCSVTDKDYEPDLETPVDTEITPKAQDLSPLGGQTSEATCLTVRKKRPRRKIMGWDTRKKSKRGAYKAAQVIKKLDSQNVEPTVTEEKNDSFAKSSEPDGEVLFAPKPLDDNHEEDAHPADEEMVENVSGHSGCQALPSLNTPPPLQLEDKKVDGCTQYCKEEVKKQVIMAEFPEGQSEIQQLAQKAQTSIICRFCKRSFRHISAYTVHQRLHTGERPYQCQQCGKRFSQLSKLKSHRNEHKSQGFIQCPCCSQRFSKKEQLITHFKVHLTNAEPIISDEKSSQVSPSKCSTRRMKSTGNCLSCSVCSQNFPSKHKLQIHKRIHQDEQFSCKDCGKTFSKQSSLSAHERVHWPLKPYACSVCGKGFRKLLALKAHSLEHTGETPFFCSHCGYACNDLQTLRAHQSSRICSVKRQDDIEGFLIQMGVDGQVNTPSLFKCHLCKKLLNYWCQYTLHLQTHTKAHPYLCDACGQSYDRFSDVRVHCRDCCKSSGEEKACSGPLTDIWNSLETEEIPQISHEPQSPEHMDEVCLILNDQSSISPDNSPINASMQGEVLPQSDNPEPVMSLASSPARSDVSILSSHPSLDCYIVSTYSSHARTSQKRFECQHCGQRFRLSSIFRAHLQTHLSGNKYTCGLCGRVFQRWHKLWLHHRLHQQKGRSFSCSDCNVQFHFLALYRQHLQEHAEQRPYACPLCPETFDSEASLNTHQNENHRLRRTLKCDVCGKGFSNLRNWVKHSLLHNGRSSHSCLLCDQSFTNNRALQDHLKMHNNDLRFPTSEIPSEPLLFPHQCWSCNASFSTGELLYAHQICHAAGGKPPPRPRGPPTAHGSTHAVTSTAPPPIVPAPSSDLDQPEPQETPIPEISDESLFAYAHPDSLYVVPDPTPPPPRPAHSFSQSGGLSSSQASNLTSSQQVIVLDEEVYLRDTTDTSLNAPGTSQTIPDASSNQDSSLPQTSTQQSITQSMSNIPEVQRTLSPKHKSKDGVKSFSITVKLQDSRGFECADCSKVLSSAKQLHKHYLKHAKGVLAKIQI